MAKHQFKPETTNGGRCFSDCSCGWSGGVYENRSYAKKAHDIHVNQEDVLAPGKVKPVFLVGPPPQGMTSG